MLPENLFFSSIPMDWGPIRRMRRSTSRSTLFLTMRALQRPRPVATCLPHGSTRRPTWRRSLGRRSKLFRGVRLRSLTARSLWDADWAGTLCCTAVAQAWGHTTSPSPAAASSPPGEVGCLGMRDGCGRGCHPTRNGALSAFPMLLSPSPE